MAGKGVAHTALHRRQRPLMQHDIDPFGCLPAAFRTTQIAFHQIDLFINIGQIAAPSGAKVIQHAHTLAPLQ